MVRFTRIVRAVRIIARTELALRITSRRSRPRPQPHCVRTVKISEIRPKLVVDARTGAHLAHMSLRGVNVDYVLRSVRAAAPTVFAHTVRNTSRREQ